MFDWSLKACTCNSGSQLLSNGTCATCPIGTESSADKLSCVSCGSMRFRNSSMASCGYCIAGTEPSSDGSSCVCTAGKYLINGACSDCPIGKEPNALRTGCTDCVGGKFRPVAQYTQCMACPLFGSCNSTALISCAAGYKINSDGTACEQCAIGTQSNADFRSCVNCASGTTFRSSISQASCQNCPSNSACTATGFTCNAGYEPTLDGLGCSQCQEGYSKATSGNTACAQCVIGTESAANKQSCVSCGTGKYRPNTLTNKCVPCPQGGSCNASVLICNAGYKLNTNGDGCDQCSVGQQSNAGFTACVSCTSGTNYRSLLSQPTCQTCPSNAACTVTGFTCNAGYEPTLDGLGCSQCQEGYSKSASGNTVCTQCSTGQESAADRLSCVACPTGFYRPTTSVNKCIPCPQNGLCSSTALTKCQNGFKKNVAGTGCEQCPIGQDSSDGLNCVGCGAGYFKPDQTFATCIPCPLGSSCGGTSVTCPSGYYFDTNAQCKRNDTFFALQQTGTQSASTVTAYITVTQTQTSTFTTTSTSTTTTTTTSTTTSVSISTTSLFQTATITQTAAGNNQQQQTQTNTVTLSVNSIQTVTATAASQGQSAQSANSVTIEFLGTLPISPLILVIVAFGCGLFIMLILSLVCCRRAPGRRKYEEYDASGMTTTAMNTTSQRTFTSKS